MIIRCPNCHNKFETYNPTPDIIAMCPYCGAPYIQNGTGVVWG